MAQQGVAAQWDAERAEGTQRSATRGVRRDAWRMLRRARLGMAGLVVLCIITLAAIAAPWVAPHDPYEGSLGVSRRCPAFTTCPNLGGSFARTTATEGTTEY